MDKIDILESIESIDEQTRSSELAVLEAMISSYEKYAIIMENYNGDIDDTFDFVIQEGKILDSVKNKGKNDSNKIVTILLFIPRIIKALCLFIKNKIHKDIDALFKEAEEKYEKLETEELKKEKAKEINELIAREGKINGECYYDEESGMLKFKKEKDSIYGTLMRVLLLTIAVSKVVERINDELDIENPSSIRRFIDSLDVIIHGGGKSVNKADVVNDGLFAIGDILKHITGVTAVMGMTADAIEKKAETLRIKDMIKDDENKKKQEILKNISELSEKLTKINTMITAGVGTVSIFVDGFLMLFSVGRKVAGGVKDTFAATYNAQKELITDELRKQYPKNKGETDAEWEKRLVAVIIKDKTASQLSKESRQYEKNLKKKAKEEKQKKVETYKKEKEERRKNNKTK